MVTYYWSGYEFVLILARFFGVFIAWVIGIYQEVCLAWSSGYRYGFYFDVD